MSRYVALLRAVNVGGRSVAMPELRAALTAAGHSDVVTYLASGNVVLTSSLPPAAVATSVAEVVRARFGLQAPALVRTRPQLQEVLAAAPFPGRDPARTHVAFCSTAPSAERAALVEAADFAPDEVRVLGEHVFLHTPNGLGRSRLTNALLERRLAVVVTVRTWRTVARLLELTGG